MTPATTAYSYIRCSTSTQAEHGTTEERQLAIAHRYADQRGWRLDDRLRDLGRSAYTGKHRKFALGGFIAAISNGDVAVGSVLLVEEIDRLSREPTLEHLTLLTAIINAGVKIVTLQDETEYSRDAINQKPYLLYSLIGKIQQAHDYGRNLSERVTRGKEIKRKIKLAASVPITKMCPSWLKVEGGKYILISERVETLKWIFVQLEAGRGRDWIANDLNKRKVPLFHRAGQGLASHKIGTGWHASFVTKLRHNPAVVGDFVPSRKSVGTDGRVEKDLDAVQSGHFPSVIARETFDRLQTRQPAGRRGGTFANLLTGLASCMTCGAQMVLKDGGVRKAIRADAERSRRRLVCTSALRKTGCTNRPGFIYIDLERSAIDVVGALTKARDFPGVQRASRSHESDIVGLTEKVQQETRKVRRMYDLLVSPDADTSPLRMAWLKDAEAKVEALQRQLARAKASEASRDALESVRDDEINRLVALYKKAENEANPAARLKSRTEMAAILRRYIDEIQIDGAKKLATTWFGGGLIFATIHDGAASVMVINDTTCLVLDRSGSVVRTATTPPWILENHRRVVAGSSGDTARVEAILATETAEMEGDH